MAIPLLSVVVPIASPADEGHGADGGDRFCHGFSFACKNIVLIKK
jgi:hypothetical protein